MAYVPSNLGEINDVSSWTNNQIQERLTWIKNNGLTFSGSNAHYARVPYIEPIVIPNGRHVMLNTVSMFAWNMIKSENGGFVTLDASAIPAGQFAFEIKNADNALTGNTGGSTSSRFPHYTSFCLQDLRIIGGGVAGCNGVDVGNTVAGPANSGDNRSTRGGIMQNCELLRFRKGIRVNSVDTYLCYWDQVNIADCLIGFTTDDVSAYQNAGERHNFTQSTIFGCETGIYLNAPGFHIHFNGLSMDFLLDVSGEGQSTSQAIYLGPEFSYAGLTLNDFWIEAIGTPTTGGKAILSEATGIGGGGSAATQKPKPLVRLVNGKILPRRGTSGNNDGGAWRQMISGNMRLVLDNVEVPNEVVQHEATNNATNPLYFAGDGVDIVGTPTLIFSGFLNGFKQTVIAESHVSNRNHDFSLVDADPADWTVANNTAKWRRVDAVNVAMSIDGENNALTLTANGSAASTGYIVFETDRFVVTPGGWWNALPHILTAANTAFTGSAPNNKVIRCKMRYFWYDTNGDGIGNSDYSGDSDLFGANGVYTTNSLAKTEQVKLTNGCYFKVPAATAFGKLEVEFSNFDNNDVIKIKAIPTARVM